MTSDDGFEIGRVTAGGSFQLAGAMAAAGAAIGVLYSVVRDTIPSRARAALWSLFAAGVEGSQFVHADGVDYTPLDPRWPAMASFVALAALVVVVLVERWLAPDVTRPRPVVLAIAAVTGTIALVLAAAAVVVVLGARRLGLSGRLAAVGRVVMPAALAIGNGRGGVGDDRRGVTDPRLTSPCRQG